MRPSDVLGIAAGIAGGLPPLHTIIRHIGFGRARAMLMRGAL